MITHPDYSIHPIKGGKFVIQAPSTTGMKTRAARLAEALKGRWTHGAGGYTVSARAAEKFPKLYEEGWDGSIMSRELVAPEGVKSEWAASSKSAATKPHNFYPPSDAKSKKTWKAAIDFNSAVVKIVLAHGGALPAENWQKLSMQTKAGELGIKPSDTWIHMQFEDVKRATQVLNDLRIGTMYFNEHSGKWNLNYDDPADNLSELEKRLGQIAAL
jgi:hypothetical protein